MSRHNATDEEWKGLFSMDTMRGNFGSLADTGGYDPADDDAAPQAPPPAIGTDERRMQVRAYNHWAGLLEDRNFPSIEALEPNELPDFGPYSVLLDFSTGIENPGIAYLGDKLAAECDCGDEELSTLDDVPARSLLTRITDHYMQILANQAPIGFEAEFVNQRGATIAYRGILLPFSSDDDTIDFIYGVINWKELADAQASDELLLEIDQALEPAAKLPALDADAPLTDWADGPGTSLDTDFGTDAANDQDDLGREEYAPEEFAAGSFGVGDFEDEDEEEGEDDEGLPLPSFGSDDEEEPSGSPGFGSLLKMPIQLKKEPIELSELELSDELFDEPGYDGLTPAVAEPFGAIEVPQFGEFAGETDEPMSEAAPVDAPVESGVAEFDGHELDADNAIDLPDPFELAVAAFDGHELDTGHAIDLPELAPAEMGLGDWLAAAREMAAVARNNEDRTRTALYDAIGRAYDFSLAAADAPDEFNELVIDSGLTTQDRAPMTPVVKLVFGSDYDKTRLTEYAAALTHAHRLELPRGALGDFLRSAEGGLKGVVKAERRLRREEAGKALEPLDAPRHALAKALRALPAQGFEALSTEGSEFALVMIRRTETGDVAMLGEVPEDVALVERAARRLIG